MLEGRPPSPVLEKSMTQADLRRLRAIGIHTSTVHKKGPPLVNIVKEEAKDNSDPVIDRKKALKRKRVH